LVTALCNMTENNIPITDWDSSPLPSAISYGPEGSVEQYWEKMTTTYAEAENGSLDDQFEKEFADDIFEVFRESDDGLGSEDDDEDNEGDEEDIEDQEGHTLLSIAQGMMMQDDDDDYDNEYEDDDDEGSDEDGVEYGHDSGVAQQEHVTQQHVEQERSVGGMSLDDMLPRHTPVQGASVKPKNSSGHSYQQAPTRPSPSELRQLASSYEIEQSEDEESEEEDVSCSDEGDEDRGAAGFLMDSDGDDDEDDIPAGPKKNPQQPSRQQDKVQKQPRRPSATHRRPQPGGTKPKASHPFLRQESGRDGSAGDKKQKQKKSKKEIEKKHKMLLLAIVQKKQQEEEELLLAVKKAEAKRKKFKEALLEKAMRSKQLKAEEDEEREQMRGMERDAKATEKQTKAIPPVPRKVTVNRPTRIRSVEQAPQEDDEAALKAEEDEARAKMEAAVRARKRFVKNQKAILSALQAKKEEKMQQEFQREQEEERLRELKRKRNEKFLKQREQKKSEQEQEEERAAAMVEATVGVGSALSAVRATRSQEGSQLGATKRVPASRSVSATAAPSTPTENEGEEGRKKARAPRRRMKKVQETISLRKERENQENEKDEVPEDPAVKEKRREDARLRQEKVSAQLALLADQRKEAADAARRKEERAKVRAELLRQRVQLEYNERKLMAAEDQYVNGDIKIRKPKIGAVVPVEEKPKKKKITTEMAEAMVDRMQVKKLKAKNAAEGKEGVEPSIADVASLLPPARDFVDWKKKHGVPLENRVFCMTGWYPCVKEALLARGWVYNPDPASPHFDLKWTLKSSDVTKGSLQPWQLTNHYLKNVALTTKIGLMKSLHQLSWFADISPNDIFPRGYDLSSPLEIQEYLDDFRHDHVVNLMKKLYLKVTGLETPVVDTAPLPSPRPEMSTPDSKDQVAVHPVSTAEPEVSPPPPPIVDNLDEVMVNKAVLNACFSVLTRYLHPHFAENGVDQDITADTKTITAMEWELVEKFDLYSATTMPDVSDEPVDDFLREKEREAELAAAQALPNLEKKKAMSDINHRNRREQYRGDKERERACDALTKMIPLGQAGLLRLHTLLSQCKIVSRTQYGLNGNASTAKNMWIVKPAAKSRGRGIMAFNDLRKLLAYVELGKTGKSILTSSQWIVQKYMENPLIIANRKFDFRQWVLVVSWNPLTIYFYNEFYCRFSSEDYDTSDEAMSNTYVHLVNNSIGKDNENFHKAIKADNGEDIKEFMWSDQNFTDYVRHATKSDQTIVNIKNRMKDIAIWSLMCGADAIEHRKNSWELYGFDYMMDDEWNPWLIEINSSPACDYSTKVTERYIKKALVEVLNVTLDIRAWEKLSKNSRSVKPDTGGWECIYTGPTMDTNTNLGTDMCVQGEPMKVPRKRQPPVQRQQTLSVESKEKEKEDGVETKRTGSSSSGASSQKTLVPTITPRNTTADRKSPKTLAVRSSPASSSPPQKQSELLPSPIEVAGGSAKPTPIHTESIANLVEQNDSSGLQSQRTPIEFDDSDDDLSVEQVEGAGQDRVVQALDKLENDELTAQVRAMVAVPLNVQQLELPTMAATEAASDTRSTVKKGTVKTRRGMASLRGQESSGAIPIKTYDPFA